MRSSFLEKGRGSAFYKAEGKKKILLLEERKRSTPFRRAIESFMEER